MKSKQRANIDFFAAIACFLYYLYIFITLYIMLYRKSEREGRVDVRWRGARGGALDVVHMAGGACQGHDRGCGGDVGIGGVVSHGGGCGC